MKIHIRKLWLKFISILFVSMFLTACSTTTNTTGESNAQSGKVLNIESKDEIATLDGSTYDIPTSNIYAQIFEGLYRKTGQGTEVELGQAKSVNVSEDGKTYTFTLRDDIYWENGEPVTAHDFEFGIKRTVDPASSAYPTTSDEIIENGAEVRSGEMPPDELGVKALEDKTLRIQLDYAAPYFPFLLSGVRFAPINQDFFEQAGENYGTSSKYVLANGPFKIENWQTSDTQWQLTKNEEYWDSENVALDTVNMFVVPNTNTAVNLFENGQLDYVTLNSDFAQQYQGSEYLHSELISHAGDLELNPNKKITSNNHLGRAIFYSIDRTELTEDVLNDGSIPTSGYIPYKLDTSVGDIDFREQAGQYYTFEPERGQEELNQALEELRMESIDLELMVSDDKNNIRLAEFFQSELEENLNGLNITIRSIPEDARVDTMRNGDWDLTYYVNTPFIPDAFGVLEWNYSDGINTAGYSNPEYDQLLDTAKYEFGNNPKARREIMMEAERLKVYEDASNSQTHQLSRSYLLSPNVQNFNTYPVGNSIYLRNVSITNEK